MAIHVEATPGRVSITLTWLSALLAVKRRLEITAEQMIGVEVMSRGEVPRTPGAWLRAPGTHLPGLIRYGSYGRAPQREFWAVLRQSQVLVLELADADYSRVVLGRRDAAATAAEVRLAGGTR